MNTFNNDLAALESARAELRDLDKWLENNYCTRATMDEYAEKANRAEFLKVLVAILTDNTRRALVAEVLPVALEIVKKYEGKPYGEKTREKISEAVKEKTGCRFFLYDKYIGGEMSFYPSEPGRYARINYLFGVDDLNISAEYDREKREYPRFLIENRVQPIDAGKLYLHNCAEYVDDPEARAREIMEKFSVVRDAVTAAEKACNDLSAVLPSKMKHHNISGFDRYLF